MADPTIDDVKKMFQDAGFAVNGDWEAKSQKKLGIPGVMEESQKALKTVKVLIEKQIAKDKQSIADAYISLSRLEHGGGN